MQFADITNGIAFRKIFGNEKTAPLISFLNAALELEGDKHNWSKDDLIAYDNFSIWKGDQRQEIETAMQKGEEKSKIELIFEMDKEGLTVPQIARVTKKSEEEITQILGSQKNK